uniref:Sfi1 spindle body domain-containing protein n=1 Tax=Globisporangium ultimum (strain ATCC 200006 / CBS 805.95 / DAOM BR144) TaxID=431595 RepID=K3WN21_GLOUD
MRQKLLRTWRRLQSRLRHRKLRIGGCVKVLELVGRWTLRVAWHNWKRQHQLASVGVMLATKQNASARFDNILARLVTHRHSKDCQRHAFVRWRAFVQREMRLRRLLKHWMTTNQRIDLTRLTKQCFAAWQSVCTCQTQRMTILNRLVTRKRHLELRSALHQWRYQALKVIYHSQLQRAKQVLKRSQMANAKRVAMMVYTAWKRPCLESCFTRWRAYLQEKKRRLHTIMMQFTTTRNVRLVTSVFRMWLQYTRVKKTAVLLWQSYRRDIGYKVMACVFHTWKALILTEQRRKTLLHRLGVIVRVWQLRKWFKELQLQHHEVKSHRALMTVVLSAQSALRQQKQQHVLKTIAIMLRRRQKTYLNTIFVSWKLLWDAQRTMKRFMAVTQRRFERRRLHRMVTHWKMFVNTRKATSRLNRKLQQMRTQRALTTVFRAWTAGAQQCHDIKTFVYHRIFTSRAHHALHAAWSTWQRFVRHTSLEGERERVMLFAIESQQQRGKVDTLTTRSESLLIETMILKNRIQELRQRNLGLFCWKLASVATKTELTRAFITWKDRIAKMHMLHVVLVRLGHQKQNCLFQHWRATTIARRVHDAQQQQQQSDKQAKLAKAMLSLLAPSNSECAIKWSMLLRWKAATTSRRKSRKRTQVLFTLATKHHDKRLMHGCYAQWNARVARRKAQLSVLRLLQLRFNGNLRHEAYLKWLRWHWRLREWRRGIQLITNVLTRRQKHDLRMRWWTWRVHCRQQKALASFNGKITVLELENWNACCQSTLEQLMLLVFLNWKALVRTRQARRHERELVSQEFQSRYNALRRHFEAWHNLLKSYQTRIHPVLCTQTPWKTVTKAARLREAPEAPRVRYCRFNEYRRRVQSARWQCAQRQRTSKSMLRRERVHLAAFTMLIQSVRRQHLRVQRHALWIWFARTQAISPTLATIPFRAMPWRFPRVQFAG